MPRDAQRQGEAHRQRPEGGQERVRVAVQAPERVPDRCGQVYAQHAHDSGV